MKNKSYVLLSLIAVAIAAGLLFSFDNKSLADGVSASDKHLATPVASVCSIGNNRLVNGGAEGDPAATGNGSIDHDVSSWDSETGQFTITRYTTGGGYPIASSPGPINRGAFFFSGGETGIGVNSSSASQIISVTDCATEIDAGGQKFSLSGFLGGFQTQSDDAQLTITFKDGVNATLGTSSIGPVTAANRANITGMFLRISGGTVPANTRTIEVVLLLSKSEPAFTSNDGYADDLSFRLLPVEYNAANEFSLTQGGTTGVWGYGHSVSGIDDTFVPATQGVVGFPCGFAFDVWTDPVVEADVPAVGHNQGATFYCGSTSAWSSGLITFHPGYHFAASRRAVLRWTAPSAGTFLVNGSFLKHSSTATTDVRILKNVATPLFSGNVNSGAYDQPFALSVTVLAGDTLDFSIGSGGDGYYGDQTALALTIGQPVTACQPAPSDLSVSIQAENSPSDVKSGNTNATLVGDATYTNSGRVGRAFSFDGAGDYVRIEDNAAQRPTDQLTLEGWFKFNTASGLVQMAGKPIRGNFTNSYALYLENGLLSGFVGNTTQYTRVQSNFNPQIGVWQHLAFTYAFSSGVSTLKLYANGVEVTKSVDGTLNLPLFYEANPYPLLIGADFENDVPSFPLNGQADEVSLYSRALTQTELFNITKQGTFGKCPLGNCVQSPQGLVSWFQGEANATDSRSNNHGTIQGNVTYASGKTGAAYRLGGTGDMAGNGDRVLVGNPANLQLQDFTIETWIRRASSTVVTNSPTGGGDAGIFFAYGQNGYGLAIFGATGQLVLSKIGVSAVFAPTTPITDTNFHHIAVTKTGNQVIFYVDGVATAPQTFSDTFTFTTNAAIGARGDNYALDAFFGDVDELSIYSRALSSTELQSIVTAGQSGKCKPSPLNPTTNQVAWFSGDGNANDISGNNNNGVFVGTSSYGVGKVGQDLKFAGFQTVQAPDNATLDLTNAFTMEAWVSPTAAGLPTQQTFFVSKGNMNFGNTQSYGILFYQDQRIGNRVGNGSTFATLNSTGQIPLNAFTHIATTYDGSTLRIYINGVLDSSQATGIGTLLNSSQPLIVGGGDFNGSTINVQSAIDEASVYNRALTASELAAIYQAGVAGKLKSTATPVNLSAGELAPGSLENKTISTPSLAPTVVQLTDATVTFAQVTTSGITTESNIDLAMLPPIPSYLTATGLNYDISTTAAFTTATLCFNLPSINVEARFNNLRILHLEGMFWQDRTDPASVSFATRTICTRPRSSFSPFVIAEGIAPTAANVSISGRVTTSSGRGISGAVLTLTSTNGTTRHVRTGSFGYYIFNEAAAGENYVLSIASKRFTFAIPTRIVNATSDITDEDFTADDQFLLSEISTPVKSR